MSRVPCGQVEVQLPYKGHASMSNCRPPSVVHDADQLGLQGLDFYVALAPSHVATCGLPIQMWTLDWLPQVNCLCTSALPHTTLRLAVSPPDQLGPQDAVCGTKDAAIIAASRILVGSGRDSVCQRGLACAHSGGVWCPRGRQVVEQAGDRAGDSEPPVTGMCPQHRGTVPRE